MADQPYDPVARKARYERTKQLKGRHHGETKPAAVKPSRAAAPHKPALHPSVKAAGAKIGRLRGKVAKLTEALSEVEAELSKKRQSARKTQKKNSDGKSTAKEKQASKEYRDKHKQKLATKEKKSSSSGGGSSRSSSKSVSDMSVRELQARASKIRSVLRDAKQQLASASVEHGQLVHSAITSASDVGEHFARYITAERIPSK